MKVVQVLNNNVVLAAQLSELNPACLTAVADALQAEAAHLKGFLKIYLDTGISPRRAGHRR